MFFQYSDSFVIIPVNLLDSINYSHLFDNNSIILCHYTEVNPYLLDDFVFYIFNSQLFVQSIFKSSVLYFSKFFIPSDFDVSYISYSKSKGILLGSYDGSILEFSFNY